MNNIVKYQRNKQQQCNNSHPATPTRSSHGCITTREVTRWCSGKALDSWSRGRGPFNSDRGIIRATTLGKLFTPNVPLFTKQHNLVPCEGFLLKAPYCWQRHRVQWSRGYWRAVLRWSSDCLEPRYKSSALPLQQLVSACTRSVTITINVGWLVYLFGFSISYDPLCETYSNVHTFSHFQQLSSNFLIRSTSETFNLIVSPYHSFRQR